MSPYSLAQGLANIRCEVNAFLIRWSLSPWNRLKLTGLTTEPIPEVDLISIGFCPRKPTTHSLGMQSPLSLPFSVEDYFTLLKSRQSSVTHLLNRSFSEMFALILCFCCKISAALLCSWGWWIHEMNVCIFMTASLESGSAGQPPWRNDEMTTFWLSRKAAEIQSVVLRKASNQEESCCEIEIKIHPLGSWGSPH